MLKSQADKGLAYRLFGFLLGGYAGPARLSPRKVSSRAWVISTDIPILRLEMHLAGSETAGISSRGLIFPAAVALSVGTVLGLGDGL